MKWKFVFNSNINSKYWGTSDKCLEFVKKTGYKFWTWNGQVFDLNDKNIGLTTEDLF